MVDDFVQEAPEASRYLEINNHAFICFVILSEVLYTYKCVFQQYIIIIEKE